MLSLLPLAWLCLPLPLSLPVWLRSLLLRKT